MEGSSAARLGTRKKLKLTTGVIFTLDHMVCRTKSMRILASQGTAHGLWLCVHISTTHKTAITPTPQNPHTQAERILPEAGIATATSPAVAVLYEVVPPKNKLEQPAHAHYQVA
eukprot:728872-Pelagomonas_calceolata.AAC.4